MSTLPSIWIPNRDLLSLLCPHCGKPRRKRDWLGRARRFRDWLRAPVHEGRAFSASGWVFGASGGCVQAASGSGCGCGVGCKGYHSKMLLTLSGSTAPATGVCNAGACYFEFRAYSIEGRTFCLSHDPSFAPRCVYTLTSNDNAIFWERLYFSDATCSDPANYKDCYGIFIQVDVTTPGSIGITSSIPNEVTVGSGGCVPVDAPLKFSGSASLSIGGSVSVANSGVYSTTTGSSPVGGTITLTDGGC